MPHKAIAKLLSDRFGVPGWWSQMIAVGYEQARGLREPNQKADGFAANASRTVAAGLDRLYGAWTDPSLRALWLGAVPVEIRRATDGKSIRLAWKGGESTVEVHFVRKAPGRSHARDAGEGRAHFDRFDRVVRRVLQGRRGARRDRPRSPRSGCALAERHPDPEEKRRSRRWAAGTS
jgi:hypothetical protein